MLYTLSPWPISSDQPGISVCRCVCVWGGWSAHWCSPALRLPHIAVALGCEGTPQGTPASAKPVVTAVLWEYILENRGQRMGPEGGGGQAQSPGGDVREGRGHRGPMHCLRKSLKSVLALLLLCHRQLLPVLFFLVVPFLSPEAAEG